MNIFVIFMRFFVNKLIWTEWWELESVAATDMHTWVSQLWCHRYALCHHYVTGRRLACIEYRLTWQLPVHFISRIFENLNHSTAIFRRTSGTYIKTSLNTILFDVVSWPCLGTSVPYGPVVNEIQVIRGTVSDCTIFENRVRSSIIKSSFCKSPK